LQILGVTINGDFSTFHVEYRSFLINDGDDLRVRKNGNLDEKKIAKLRNKGKFQFFENMNEFLESDIQVYKNQKKTDGNIAGIPQGLPISALLANIYMLPFDKQIINELVEKKDCFYRRYSDDLVVVCKTEDVQEIEEFVMNEIKKIKLDISPSKTEKFRFKTENNQLTCYKIENDKYIPNAYLQYLGFDFYGNKILIKSANISRFYREMKESIRMKDKRVEKVQEKYLTDDCVVFKRKILRLFSFKGVKSRIVPAKKLVFRNGQLETDYFDRKYRGNFIKYAYRASDIMEAPEIRRQIRRHYIILKEYLAKFEFDNA
jgi:DNA-binding Lrp family transcriptional regulator